MDAFDRLIRLRAWMLAVVLLPCGIASAVAGEWGLGAALVVPSLVVLAILMASRSRRERAHRR